jgi:hypothetical protein
LIKIKLIEGNGAPFEKITMLLVGVCFEGCLRKYDSAIDWKQIFDLIDFASFSMFPSISTGGFLWIY